MYHLCILQFGGQITLTFDVNVTVVWRNPGLESEVIQHAAHLEVNMYIFLGHKRTDRQLNCLMSSCGLQGKAK